MPSYIWEAWARGEHGTLIRAMGRFTDKRDIEKDTPEISAHAKECALDRFSDCDPKSVIVSRIWMEEPEPWEKEYE